MEFLKQLMEDVIAFCFMYETRKLVLQFFHYILIFSILLVNVSGIFLGMILQTMSLGI